MTDYFALLNQPRRPWLDAEALKRQFLARSAAAHPDRAHAFGDTERAAAQAGYVELNAAYQCLREPKDRLRCLLELECGSAPPAIERIPPDLMELFLETGRVCRDADVLSRERNANRSPLLKVQLFERAQSEIQTLDSVREKISARRDAAVHELKRLDAEWQNAPHPDSRDRAGWLGRLEELYRLFGYFDRWLKQIQDRVVALSV